MRGDDVAPPAARHRADIHAERGDGAMQRLQCHDQVREFQDGVAARIGRDARMGREARDGEGIGGDALARDGEVAQVAARLEHQHHIGFGGPGAITSGVAGGRPHLFIAVAEEGDAGETVEHGGADEFERGDACEDARLHIEDPRPVGAPIGDGEGPLGARARGVDRVHVADQQQAPLPRAATPCHQAVAILWLGRDGGRRSPRAPSGGAPAAPRHRRPPCRRCPSRYSPSRAVHRGRPGRWLPPRADSSPYCAHFGAMCPSFDCSMHRVVGASAG